ncbi:MAG: hypothetical protein ACI861_000785 [Paracoccaceae bacterium]
MNKDGHAVVKKFIRDQKFWDYPIHEHCLQFNITRANDKEYGNGSPRIWTAQRDLDMWEALQG